MTGLLDERAETIMDIGPLGGLAGYRLRRASAAMSADYDATMQDLGVRQVHFGMLSVIAENPGIGQGALGRMLGIQRANMVPLVTEVVARGLVLRETAQNDRRALSLKLSAEGTVLLDICVQRIKAHEERMLAALSPPERALLIDLLARVEAA